jgi:hypothetical protein
MTYVGDCKFVIDAFLKGVPLELASSTSVHADLWRRARWLVNDHGGEISVLKVESHRARAHVELDGQ